MLANWQFEQQTQIGNHEVFIACPARHIGGRAKSKRRHSCQIERPLLKLTEGSEGSSQ